MGRNKPQKRKVKSRKDLTATRSDSSQLIQALCVNRKNKPTWHGSKCMRSDTKIICEGYDEEGYTSMNIDSVRNALYSRSIKSIQHPDSFWIDLGCGSSALLTLMVLKQHGKCVGIEVNPNSAASALRVLKEFATPDEFCVLVGSSGDKKVIKRLRRMVQSGQTVCVVHEIFGFFSSSEGAPLAVSQLRNSVPSARWKFLPARAGTFFQPSCLDASSTDKTHNLYVSPKMVLCRRLNFEQVRLTESCRYFEWYDFNREVSLCQQGQHSFTVTRSGMFNSISCFIFIDFGTAVARAPRCEGFPFGDERLQGSAHDMSLSSCSSSGSYATNWQNPVIVFPVSVLVSAGDTIVVDSEASVSTCQPRYSFSARVKQGDQTTELGSVNLEHGDLYPDWTKS